MVYASAICSDDIIVLSVTLILCTYLHQLCECTTYTLWETPLSTSLASSVWPGLKCKLDSWNLLRQAPQLCSSFLPPSHCGKTLPIQRAWELNDSIFNTFTNNLIKTGPWKWKCRRFQLCQESFSRIWSEKKPTRVLFEFTELDLMVVYFFSYQTN